MPYGFWVLIVATYLQDFQSRLTWKKLEASGFPLSSFIWHGQIGKEPWIWKACGINWHHIFLVGIGKTSLIEVILNWYSFAIRTLLQVSIKTNIQSQTLQFVSSITRRRRRRRKKMGLSKAMAPLCVKGCGFYGCQENKNMCSKCYKEFLKAEITKDEPKTVNMDKNLLPNMPSDSTSGETKSDILRFEPGGSGESGGSSPSVKNRCKNCNKKIGLMGFRCRCGEMFCGVHRYPKEHFCTFDFKKADRELLAKQNPLINGDKLSERIWSDSWLFQLEIF